MSRKRERGNSVGIASENRVSIAQLPNELLLEIWQRLPPLERICVSQTCRVWRLLSLSTPKLWTRVAVVSGRSVYKLGKSTLGSKKSIQSSNSTIYNPCAGSDNMNRLAELFARSGQQPLELTLIWRSNLDLPTHFFNILVPHVRRLSRIHFATGSYRDFTRLSKIVGGLPFLRTLTAGFNEDDIEYDDLPLSLAEGSSLPALNQIHLGARAQECFVTWWSTTAFLSVRELTLTPRGITNVIPALSACQNLQRLTLVMAKFYANIVPNDLQARVASLVERLVHVPELCIIDIPSARERLVRQMVNDARFRSVTLDYQGRQRPPSALSSSQLPSPCDVLSGPVQFTLSLRESVYEIAVVDSVERRRVIFLDSSTISKAPGLWNGFLKKLTIASATVDAVAWEYFVASIPHAGRVIPDLAVVILHQPSELDDVSLGLVSSIQKLRIDVVQHGLRFAPTVLSGLILSRPRDDAKASLPVLSLTEKAWFGDEESLLPLAHRLEH